MPHDSVRTAVVKKLLKLRSEPPSVIRLCWPTVPLLILVGAISVIALVALDMPLNVIFLTAGMYLGAALSAVGVARKVSRLWPIQRELFDWKKIETLASGDSELIR